MSIVVGLGVTLPNVWVTLPNVNTATVRTFIPTHKLIQIIPKLYQKVGSLLPSAYEIVVGLEALCESPPNILLSSQEFCSKQMQYYENFCCCWTLMTKLHRMSNLKLNIINYIVLGTAFAVNKWVWVLLWHSLSLRPSVVSVWPFPRIAERSKFNYVCKME